MPTKDELRNCPFCGSNFISVDSMQGLDARSLHYVICNDCRSAGASFHSMNKAIKAWNTRPRCDQCKADYEDCLTYLNTHSNKDATEFYCAEFSRRED